MTHSTNPSPQSEGSSSSTDSPDVLAALRMATKDRHAWLDAHVPLAAEHPDASDFVRHLQLVGGWLALATPLLRSVNAADGGLAQIREDLADAGAPSPDGSNLHEVPAAGLTSAPFAWGVAYVAEGSRLGGQVLFKRLAGPLSPLKLRYLQGRGDETGAHWRTFMQALRAAVTLPRDIDAACRGAVWSFDALIDGYRPRHT